jgi:hypothetical protein
VFAEEEVQHAAPIEAYLALFDINGEAWEGGVVDEAAYVDCVIRHFWTKVVDVFFPAGHHFVVLYWGVSAFGVAYCGFGTFVAEPDGVFFIALAEPGKCYWYAGSLALSA